MDRSTDVSCTHFILYTGLLFSLLLLNPVHCDDVPAGVTVTCYQGTLVTDHTSMVSLDPDSLKGLTRGVCRPPTTTPIPTTPSPTTPSAATNGTTAAPTNASTTAAPTNASTTAAPTNATTATPAAPTTKVPTTATTTAPTTKVPTTMTTATPPVTTPTTTTTAEALTTGAPTNETSRRKRAPAEPSTPEYYCHVSFGPTEDTGGKVKFNSTHTMRFYCLEAEETADECKNGSEKSVSNDTVTYCCKGDNCNSPMVVIRDTDNKVAVKTIDDCNHYDDKGTEKHPCIPGGNAHLCVKQTNKISKVETRACAYMSLQQMYCIEDDWFFMGCRNTTKNVTSCCYYPETAPPPSPTSTPVPSSGKKGNAGSIAIAVVVSFVVGTFAGCILLVFLQKKCRRRPGSDGLLDFSYNRFKSAEDTEGL